jgi:hypothetical protein
LEQKVFQKNISEEDASDDETESKEPQSSETIKLERTNNFIGSNILSDTDILTGGNIDYIWDSSKVVPTIEQNEMLS